jgi:Trk K+ transport system NAD-binding subunit
MNRLAGTPARNLISILVFMAVVVVMSTCAYMAVGWSFTDALYMVLMTVYTVGYGEVHPINTPYLHAVTMGTMVLGCTGMILVTGTLVQVLTFSQIQNLLGSNRVKTDINKLKGHVIVCGYGRIGVMLARDLKAGGAAFVILERDEARLAEARDHGYLAWQGDATDEAALQAVGIDRANALATVLPDDAANVFITLSARSLNPALRIISRGEAPSTETKLIQAGASQVILPTHIGAERIAELILFPETARFIRDSERMRDFEKVLRDLGLEMEVVVASEGTAVVGETIAQLETRAKGAFYVVQINRRGGEPVIRPPADMTIEAGDGLVVVGRPGTQINALFNAPAHRPRAGRPPL